jgi:hypothetical protein
MEPFKRSGIPPYKEVKRSEEEIKAYYEALEESAIIFKRVREESILKDARSRISAAKVIINK